jgi:hypothetical protein
MGSWALKSCDAIVERARWLVMLPRTSAVGTLAWLQSTGIKILFRWPLPITVSRNKNKKSTSSPVLGSSSLIPYGRTLSHAAIASPTTRSTGFVKEVLVLFTGTSRRHTALATRVSLVLGMVTSFLCQRIQPTGAAEFRCCEDLQTTK